MWIIIVDFFFFQSSKKLAMVMMAALINWVEMCCRATGDTGTVVKLGQCQTLQPWLSLFLSENTFFHTLTPFLSSSTHSAFSISPSFMRPLSVLHAIFPLASSVQLHCASWEWQERKLYAVLYDHRYSNRSLGVNEINVCHCRKGKGTYSGRSCFETPFESY